MGKFVRLETGRVTRVILDRPPLNVLNLEMLEDLARALREAAEAQPAIIAIGATGKAFSAGVDVADHVEDRVEKMLTLFHASFRLLHDIDPPVVALVQGPALGGGCELVAACDLVLAARSATFGQPEIKLGVFAPIAAILLPRLVGERLAAEMLLTGEPIDAERAAGAGLVNHVFPDASFEAKAGEFLDRLARGSRPALALNRAAIKTGRKGTLAEVLPRVEDLYLGRLMKTEDAREGIAAFMEKRPPRFTDR